MASSATTASAPSGADQTKSPWLPRIALAAALLILASRLAQYLGTSLQAVLFPYELDYGEGIVWQQALLIVRGEGYGPIDGFPAIVFHYPPVFHLLSAGSAALFGVDMLAAGRAVSLGGTLLSGVLAAMIVFRVCAHENSRLVALVCGATAALVALSFWPVTIWGPLMRVDMVALALSLGGFYLGMRSLSRPGLIIPAALCFTAAVFTKQTSIAGAAAVYLGLLLLNPRLAWIGIGTSIVSGLAALGFLAWTTDGGFLRHIFMYNINRFDPARIPWIPKAAGMHALYFGLGAVALARTLKGRLPHYRGCAGTLELRRRLLATPADAALLLILLYWITAALIMLTVVKSGSSINYFIEWMCVTALLIGVFIADAARAALASPQIGSNAKLGSPTLLTVLFPAALGIQVLVLPANDYHSGLMNATRGRELDRLSAEIRAAAKPVISDDMVLLLRSGKPVPWEPAIFAELASTGLYDDRPFISKVRNADFAFFVTFGERGFTHFNARYNPAVADAIDAAYPLKERVGKLTVHRPGTPKADRTFKPE